MSDQRTNAYTIFYIVYVLDAYTKLQKGIQGIRAGTEQLGAPKGLSLLSTWRTYG